MRECDCGVEEDVEDGVLEVGGGILYIWSTQGISIFAFNIYTPFLVRCGLFLDSCGMVWCGHERSLAQNAHSMGYPPY